MANADSPLPTGPAPIGPLESTATLLVRLRAGEAAARDRLAARYLPMLRHWASGRLPAHARAAADTDDLVQVTVMRALERAASFEPRREGAFLSYVRSILLNALRDQIRRASVRSGVELDDSIRDPGPSVMDEVVGRETMERYEAALAELGEEQREAVILRIEFGFSHQEIAEAVGSPSANAARMQVSRALLHLAERMSERDA